MITSLKRTALAAATLVAPLSAHAQFLSGSTITGCGGNTFVSCAAWSATATGNTLTFTIENTSSTTPGTNTNSTFTEIGIGNIGDVYTLATDGFSYSPDDGSSGSWSFDDKVNGFNGQGFLSAAFGANSDPGNPQVQGLQDGDKITFTFVFNQTIDINDFLNAQVAIHDQGAINACGNSSKAVFNGSTGELAFNGTDCGGSTVPEPSSMALLGTGLVGLVPMLRRKK